MEMDSIQKGPYGRRMLKHSNKTNSQFNRRRYFAHSSDDSLSSAFDEEQSILDGQKRTKLSTSYFDGCICCFSPSHDYTDCINGQIFCSNCAGYGHEESICPIYLLKLSVHGKLLAECNFDGCDEHQPELGVRSSHKDCGRNRKIRKNSVSSNCNIKDAKPADLRRIRCLICNRRGHANCSDPPLKVLMIYCSRCGELGHRPNSCALSGLNLNNCHVNNCQKRSNNQIIADKGFQLGHKKRAATKQTRTY